MLQDMDRLSGGDGDEDGGSQSEAVGAYAVFMLISDEQDTVDATSMLLSSLSIRSYCGNDVPICLVGSIERHGAAFSALPHIGLTLTLFPQAMPPDARVASAAAQGGWGSRVVVVGGTTTLVWGDLAGVADGFVGIQHVTTVDKSAADMAMRILLKSHRLTHWPSPAASAAPPINMGGEVSVPVCLSPDRALGPALAVRYYVVSMRGRPERERVVARLRATLPNLTVVDAIDGEALGEADVRRMVDEGFLCEPFVDRLVNGVANGQRRLLVNSVAVTLSHRRALERAAADMRAAAADGCAAPRGAVVLEDDVALLPDFLRVMDGLVATVSTLRVDVVRLYVMPSQRVAFRKTSPAMPYVLAPTPSGLWGTQAYLVPDADAADAALAALWPMLGAVDEQLSRAPGLAQFMLNGAPVVEELQAEAPSVTLGEARPARYIHDLFISGARAGQALPLTPSKSSTKMPT